uniref:Putative secreted protein n=1 Tax=Ixodes ricinus TaxID=34613 RepID=A0A6B0UI71_IXORI
MPRDGSYIWFRTIVKTFRDFLLTFNLFFSFFLPLLASAPLVVTKFTGVESREVSCPVRSMVVQCGVSHCSRSLCLLGPSTLRQTGTRGRVVPRGESRRLFPLKMWPL